jgi:predicted secreted protein
MTHTTIFFTLALGAAVAIGGCGGASEGSGKKVEEPKIEYPLAEAGATTTVGIDGYFQITQPDDTSGEPRWLFKEPPDEALLKIISEEFDGPEGDEGGPGTRVWLFQTVGAGETEITLEFLKPWEEDVPPEKRATYKIVIEAAPEPEAEESAEDEDEPAAE